MVRTVFFIPREVGLTILKRTQEGDQILQRKGRGRLIHISDFVEEENRRLIVCNEEGDMVKDAHCIIYPGVSGDLWWDHVQLLVQVDKAIAIFEEAHPNCVTLFVFDQSSAHASLGPDALHAFDMNRSNGGKQRKQKNTVIPINNPHPEFHGKAQSMTTEAGAAKGLQQMLEERSFNMQGMRAKCNPVCPIENTNCCMARLLSKQDDFRLQESLLEGKIKEKGHIYAFLPKFHCELNPIKMVFFYFFIFISTQYSYSIGVGANTGTGKFIKVNSRSQREPRANALTRALLRLSGVFLTVPGDSWMHIGRG